MLSDELAPRLEEGPDLGRESVDRPPGDEPMDLQPPRLHGGRDQDRQAGHTDDERAHEGDTSNEADIDMLASTNMAQMTREDVLRIAALAQLQLDDDECARAAAQLARILEYAEQVQQVDTSGIAPPQAASDARMRDDEPIPSLDRGVVLGQAPAADRAAGLFRVPRVLGS